MTALIIAFMGLAIVFLAVMIPLVGKIKYNHGFLAGMERKAIHPPPAGPYVCPHVWEPWSKARWTITPGGTPVSGWGRMQRRVCGQCGEEQERTV
jgi:hypothetical protein